MAEEKDTIGRDEPLNEEAPTPQTAGDAADAAPAADAPARAGKFDRLTQDEGGVRKLTGMYKNWFLDYASYVILERAVPHVEVELTCPTNGALSTVQLASSTV